MGDSIKNWMIRQKGKTFGPFTEFELRKQLVATNLGDMHLDEMQVRQGDSDWFPAKVVLAKFKELAKAGIYVRVQRSSDSVGGESHAVEAKPQGPFTAIRALGMLRGMDLNNVDAKLGADGFWISGAHMLAQLERLEQSAIERPPANDSRIATEQQGASVSAAEPTVADRVRDSTARIAQRTDDFHVEEERSGDAPKEPAKDLKLVCPGCKSSLRVTSSLAGTIIHCPTCNQQIRVAAPKASNEPKPAKKPKVLKAIPVTKAHPVAEPTASIKRPAPVAKPVAPIAKPVAPVARPVAPVARPVVPAAPVVPAPTAAPIAKPAAPTQISTSNPYSHTLPRSGQNSGDMPYPRLPRQPSAVGYVVPGVIIAVWGVLVCVLAAISLVTGGIGFATILSSDIPTEVQGRVTANLIGQMITYVIMLVGCAAMTIGAINMAMRRNLKMARASAILAVIPCFGCLAMPFGIWACVTLFSTDAEQDFT